MSRRHGQSGSAASSCSSSSTSCFVGSVMGHVPSVLFDSCVVGPGAYRAFRLLPTSTPPRQILSPVETRGSSDSDRAAPSTDVGDNGCAGRRLTRTHSSLGEAGRGGGGADRCDLAAGIVFDASCWRDATLNVALGVCFFHARLPQQFFSAPRSRRPPA